MERTEGQGTSKDTRKVMIQFPGQAATVVAQSRFQTTIDNNGVPGMTTLWIGLDSCATSTARQARLIFAFDTDGADESLTVLGDKKGFPQFPIRSLQGIEVIQGKRGLFLHKLRIHNLVN